MVGSRLGIMKVAAARVGLSLDEYQSHVAAGLKRCITCAQWINAADFNEDASRGDGRFPSCRTCQAALGRQRYEPVAPEDRKPFGPPRIVTRSGDKQQARKHINLDVRTGRRPKASDLFCAYCGHKGDDRRHEYHHHLGYAAEHHNDVVALCVPCHRRADGAFSTVNKRPAR